MHTHTHLPPTVAQTSNLGVNLPEESPMGTLPKVYAFRGHSKRQLPACRAPQPTPFMKEPEKKCSRPLVSNVAPAKDNNLVLKGRNPILALISIGCLI